MKNRAKENILRVIARSSQADYGGAMLSWHLGNAGASVTGHVFFPTITLTTNRYALKNQGMTGPRNVWVKTDPPAG